MVSAWAGINNMVLGQMKVDEKSNEITTIPELLKLLVIKGCIVTIDATGCQKEIASAILDKEANYILELKGNHSNLLQQTEDSFRFLDIQSVSEEMDAGHGRVERRTCSLVNDLYMVEQKKSGKNYNPLSEWRLNAI